MHGGRPNSKVQGGRRRRMGGRIGGPSPSIILHVDTGFSSLRRDHHPSTKVTNKFNWQGPLFSRASEKAMKVLGLAVFYNPEASSALGAAAASAASSAEPILLHSAQDVSHMGYFEQSTGRQMVIMITRLISKRTAPGTRQSVNHQESGSLVHCYKTADGLGACIVADAEYPQRVAFNLITTTLDKFKQKYGNKYAGARKDGEFSDFNDLDTALREWQDPRANDKITQINDELDKVKLVMHDNIEKILERGEKLDDLVEKSNDLTSQSKIFYKQARAQNSCCIVM